MSITTVTNDSPVHPYRDACQSHIKRKKLIGKIETRIASMEEVPVSLLSLYRGLLRDYEASSYKLMVMQPSPKKDAPRKEQSPTAQLLQEIKAERKEWREIEATVPTPQVKETPKVPLMRLDNSLLRKVSVSSMILIAMSLALLAGCVQCLPRSFLVVQGVKPVVERLQADAQLVGSGGLIPLMFVQDRKDMLHLNILERTITATSSRHSGAGCPHRHRV